MDGFTDIYLDLMEMEMAGLLQRVERDDGETGYMLTPLGDLAADAAQVGMFIEDWDALLGNAVSPEEARYEIGNIERWPCPECGGQMAIKFNEHGMYMGCLLCEHEIHPDDD